ncbi:MAG: hypothetical protein ACXABG_05800 [Promethearchaeota archaeon]
MKKTKIILLATLGLCMLSFIPAALGAAETRPISAFLENNDNILAWLDPESNLIIFPHGWVYDPQTIADCDPDGSVLVRDLKDGRILYKVNMHVKGAVILIANYTDRLIFVGEMDYTFTATLVVYGDIDDPVPNLMDVWFLGGGEGLFSHITGTGTGMFVDDWPGFTPGETAKVKVNQVGITKPEGHPFFPEIWPVELVFFH